MLARNAVVMLLEPGDDAWVRGLWRSLATDFGLHGVDACPYPHASLLGSSHTGSDELEALDDALALAAGHAPVLATRSTGLAHFPGECPVAYLALEQTADLLSLHGRIWSAMADARVLRDANPLYRPGAWVPHLTLAISDLRPEQLLTLRAKLLEHDLERPIVIREVAVLYQDGPRYRLLRRHPLGG